MESRFLGSFGDRSDPIPKRRKQIRGPQRQQSQPARNHEAHSGAGVRNGLHRSCYGHRVHSSVLFRDAQRKLHLLTKEIRETSAVNLVLAFE